jgi:hypothetical protein
MKQCLSVVEGGSDGVSKWAVLFVWTQNRVSLRQVFSLSHTHTLLLLPPYLDFLAVGILLDLLFDLFHQRRVRVFAEEIREGKRTRAFEQVTEKEDTTFHGPKGWVER